MEKSLALVLVLVMTVGASAALVNIAPDAAKSTRYGPDPTTLGTGLVDGDTATDAGAWFSTPAGGLRLQWSEPVTIVQIKFYHATNWNCHSTFVGACRGPMPDSGRGDWIEGMQVHGTGGWGGADTGAVLDLTFAPMTIQPTDYLSLYSWGSGPWSKVEEIEVYTPEPVTMSLLGIGGLALVRRRRG